MHKLFSTAGFILAALSLLIAPSLAITAPKVRTGLIIEQIDFRDVTVGDALKVLADQSNLNIVASKDAADIHVTLFLRRVTPMEVVDALSKTYNLWYQLDPESNIVRLYTVKEYRLEKVEFRKEETEVFTMKNAKNVLDLADSIQNLFSTRVRLGYGSNQIQLMTDLQQRFARFNMVDSRSKINTSIGGSTTGGTTGGGVVGGGGGVGGVGIGGGIGIGGGVGGIQGMQGMQGGMGNVPGMQGGVNGGMQGYQNTPTLDDQLKSLSSVLDKLNGEGKGGSMANALTGNAEDSQDLVDNTIRHQTFIYVGVVKDQNRVIVRTRDIDAMNEIKKIAKRLDVQSAMLLMEVKVLQIDLSDGFNSLFDFKLNSGSFNVSSLGGIVSPGSTPLTSGAASAAFGPALVATVISNNFSARLQLAENEGRVTQLATPLLLTSNQEVSRFFVGSEIPILTTYTAGSTTLSGTNGNNTTVQSPTPVYVQYKIGQTLLLTPSINDDKTVSVQILVEQSTVIPNGATILVPETSSLLGITTSALVPQTIDTVNEKSFSGSVMAKDGTAVAVGGLIQEAAGNQQTKTPFLGDIPLLGFFFRSEGQTRTRNELVIIIKPHIISSLPEAEALSQEFMKKNSIHPDADGKESLGVYSNPDKQHKGYILNEPFKEYNNQDSMDRYKWDNPNPRR